MQVGGQLVQFRRSTREARPIRAAATRAPWRESPRWWQLYALLVTIAVLGFAGEAMAATDGWRRLSEVVTAALIFGAMAFWLRRNRLRMACQGTAPDDHVRVRRVIRSHPQPHGPDAQPAALRQRQG